MVGLLPLAADVLVTEELKREMAFEKFSTTATLDPRSFCQVRK
jgi:hypothetical protein